MAGSTTIRVSEATWQRLHDLKRPGVSFDEIVTALLDEGEGAVDDRLSTNGTAVADGGEPDAEV